MSMMSQMRRTMSFEMTLGSSVPFAWMRKFWDLTCLRVEVVNTCSTSVVPILKVLATKAPYVSVWLSPHMQIVPGRVKPCSRPMMYTMPYRVLDMSRYLRPKSRTFISSFRASV